MISDPVSHRPDLNCTRQIWVESERPVYEVADWSLGLRSIRLWGPSRRFSSSQREESECNTRSKMESRAHLITLPCTLYIGSQHRSKNDGGQGSAIDVKVVISLAPLFWTSWNFLRKMSDKRTKIEVAYTWKSLRPPGLINVRVCPHASRSWTLYLWCSNLLRSPLQFSICLQDGLLPWCAMRSHFPRLDVWSRKTVRKGLTHGVPFVTWGASWQLQNTVDLPNKPETGEEPNGTCKWHGNYFAVLTSTGWNKQVRSKHIKQLVSPFTPASLICFSTNTHKKPLGSNNYGGGDTSPDSERFPFLAIVIRVILAEKLSLGLWFMLYLSMGLVQ